MLPSDRMLARQAAAREIVHPELGTYGRLFTATGFTFTPPLTNLITNPSLETDLTGIVTAGNVYYLGTTAATISRDTTQSLVGSASLKIAASTNGVGVGFPAPAGLVAGTTYAVSISFRGNVGGETVDYYVADSAQGPFYPSPVGSLTLTAGWQTVTFTFTATATVANVGVMTRQVGGTARTWFVDAVMLAQSSVVVPYFDGNTVGDTWNGVVNLSTSSQAMTNIQPTGVSKYGQPGWAYDITEGCRDGGCQTQDWELANVLRDSGLFAESAGTPFTLHIFSPSDIAGLLGWWDFSTLAGNDGDLIASVNDLSGNGRTFSQATGGNKPVLRKAANGINGLSVAQFDGAANFMTTAAFASPTAGVTALLVMKWTGTASAYKDLFLHAAAVGVWSPPYARWCIRESGGTGKMSVFVEDGSVIPGNYADANAALTTNAEVHGLRYDQANINHYKDGVVDGTNPKSGVLTSSNQPLYLGSDPLPGEFTDVKIGEALYYDNGISDANLALLSTYLRNKWATA